MKLAVALSLVLMSFAARAQSLVEYSTETLQLDPEVRVESITRPDGVDIEIVHLGNGQTVEIPVEKSALEGLNSADAQAAREEAREAFEVFVRGVTSPDFNGAMDISSDGRGEVLASKVDGQPVKRFGLVSAWLNDKTKPARIWLRQRLTTGIMANDPEMYKPAPEGIAGKAKLARMLKLAWQFVLVETVHAGFNYYDRFKAAPKMVEFGLSFDLKIEPQIFIGKFNPTQKVKALRNSYAFGVEFSFDKQAKRGRFRTRLRREKGSGGLGLPAAKVEGKFFVTDGTHNVQGGQSWYPISPPFASFVLDNDHAGHYFALGLTVGANTGDLIPGSTLTNTFANYQQKENAIDFASLPKKAAQAIQSLGPTGSSPIGAPMTCSALFN